MIVAIFRTIYFYPPGTMQVAAHHVAGCAGGRQRPYPTPAGQSKHRSGGYASDCLIDEHASGSFLQLAHILIFSRDLQLVCSFFLVILVSIGAICDSSSHMYFSRLLPISALLLAKCLCA